MKQSKYNILYNNFLFNTKSKALIKIDDYFKDIIINNKIELLTSNEINILIKNGFIVDKSKNEHIEIINSLKLNENNTLELIIFMNLKCNFNCKYCYEIKENVEFDIKYLDKIISLIKYKHPKRLLISFFGGEPTLSFDNIITIMQKINTFSDENDIKVYYHMTTNFYLLNINKLTTLARNRLTSLQITIDGDEKTHNFYRPLVNGAGSYNKIIENLIAFKNSNLMFHIQIRLNYDNHSNYDSFIKNISDFIIDDERFSFLINEIGEWSGENYSFACKTYEEVLIRKNEIENLTKKYNIYKTKLELLEIKPCYASKKNAFIIYVDKTIRKCSVHLNDDKNIVGHLDNINNIKDDNWNNFSYTECINCKVFPICLGKSCIFRRCNTFEECQNEKLKTIYMLGENLWVNLKSKKH